MKKSYISANNKISASDEWRSKTIQAMQAAQQQPVKKAIRFEKKWAAIAACAVFALCIPAAASLLGGFQAPKNDLQNQLSATQGELQNEAGAAPEAANFKLMPLTLENATAIMNDGLAYIEGTQEVGGYEKEGLSVNSAQYDEISNTYKFTVVDKNGKSLILIVY